LQIVYGEVSFERFFFLFLSIFFFLDKKETKNQGCLKTAKIYCIALQRTWYHWEVE
jgi:hypothetical protein